MFSESEHMFNLNELTFRFTDAPTVQERVFAYAAEVAGEEITESKVRDALTLPKSTAHVALASLVEQEILVQRRVGRTKLYAADPENPLVMTIKVAQAIRRVQLVIVPVRDALDLVVLFGSASQGRNRRGSDVDILVVARDTELALNELAQHQWLQPVVMTSAEHMQLIAKGGTLAADVARGITILEQQ